MKVKDVMTREVVTVAPSASIREAAQLLVANRISGLVVTDGGVVVGVLSEADILARERGHDDTRHGILGRLLEGGAVDPRLEARNVGEMMSAPVISVGSGTTVAEAAALMLDSAVNRLPVVDDGRLVGLVARSDLVRAFVRTDEEILREIREDVIGRTFWMEPGEVAVTVENGEVGLSGEVETRGEAEMLPALVERVPGVLSVRSMLSYRTEGAPRAAGGTTPAIKESL